MARRDRQAVRRTKTQREREEKEAMRHWDKCEPCRGQGVRGPLGQICGRCEGIGYTRKSNSTTAARMPTESPTKEKP